MNKVNGNQSKCKKNATEANYKQKQTQPNTTKPNQTKPNQTDPKTVTKTVKIWIFSKKSVKPIKYQRDQYQY